MNMTYEAQIETESVDELKKIIDSFIKKEKEYLSEITIMKEQIRYLQDKLFGRKSEKISLGFQQISLFETAKDDFPIAEQAEEDEIEVPGHKRKKRGRKPIPENFPRIEVIHDVDEAEKQCECGYQKKCIGQDISEQLDIIPPKIKVIRNIRLKYACKKCEGLESNGPTVIIAPMPEQLIPKCIGTAGLISFVLVAKFVDALPFYRQEKQFLRIGIKISRATMCSWAQKVAQSCDILLMMLKKEILSGPLINIDETPVQVLKEPKRTSQAKSYMWIFRGGIRQRSGILFEYHPTRAGDVAAVFLKGYKGIVQTDGYAGYGFIDRCKDILHMGCWAHVRRKFFDVVKAADKPKDGNRKPGNADYALKYIRKLYRIEKEAKAKGLINGALFKERQEKAKPVLDEFKRWLDSKFDKVPPKSLLGKAIAYTLNQWSRLVVYADTDYVTMDNNMAENAIRPFVIGRKNWLFSGTPDGASASAAIYSLVETAKANGLEPYWYFRYLLEKLPKAITEDDHNALLPQYLDKSQLEGPANIS